MCVDGDYYANQLVQALFYAVDAGFAVRIYCRLILKLSRAFENALLRLLLLLLADAHLEVQDLGVLKSLMIVARHGVGEVLIDIGVLGQDSHQSETVVAGGAEGPESFNVRNCHNSK